MCLNHDTNNRLESCSLQKTLFGSRSSLSYKKASLVFGYLQGLNNLGMRLSKMQAGLSLIQPRVKEYQMKKSTLIALFIIAFAAGLSPVVAHAQPVCAYPAQWVWRGYWNCEYPAQVYYAPPYYYPYYGYPYAHFGAFVGRPFFRSGVHFGGGFRGGVHFGGGFRGGGHFVGGHGGHR
jgi:uncharacterized membrane protein YgcG